MCQLICILQELTTLWESTTANILYYGFAIEHNQKHTYYICAAYLAVGVVSTNSNYYGILFVGSQNNRETS